MTPTEKRLFVTVSSNKKVCFFLRKGSIPNCPETVLLGVINASNQSGRYLRYKWVFAKAPSLIEKKSYLFKLILIESANASCSPPVTCSVSFSRRLRQASVHNPSGQPERSNREKRYLHMSRQEHTGVQGKREKEREKYALRETHLEEKKIGRCLAIAFLKYWLSCAFLFFSFYSWWLLIKMYLCRQVGGWMFLAAFRFSIAFDLWLAKKFRWVGGLETPRQASLESFEKGQVHSCCGLIWNHLQYKVNHGFSSGVDTLFWFTH